MRENTSTISLPDCVAQDVAYDDGRVAQIGETQAGGGLATQGDDLQETLVIIEVKIQASFLHTELAVLTESTGGFYLIDVARRVKVRKFVDHAKGSCLHLREVDSLPGTVAALPLRVGNGMPLVGLCVQIFQCHSASHILLIDEASLLLHRKAGCIVVADGIQMRILHAVHEGLAVEMVLLLVHVGIFEVRVVYASLGERNLLVRGFAFLLLPDDEFLVGSIHDELYVVLVVLPG